MLIGLAYQNLTHSPSSLMVNCWAFLNSCCCPMVLTVTLSDWIPPIPSALQWWNTQSCENNSGHYPCWTVKIFQAHRSIFLNKHLMANFIKFQLMTPGHLVLWHSLKSSVCSWIIRTPTFGTSHPKSLNLILHTWTQGIFYDWQLLGETADVLLPYPHQMVLYEAGSPAQNSSGILRWLDCQSKTVRESFFSHIPC